MDWIRYPFTCYMRFFPDSDARTLVRWQYAREGAKTLPFYTRFANGQMDQDKQDQWEGIGQVPDGPLRWGIKPKVSPLLGRAPVGTAQQFREGVPFGQRPPLPQCIRAPLPQPGGQACATGCDQCPRVSPVWIVDSPDFGCFTKQAIVKQEGCCFSAKPVQGVPGCPSGTPAAWEVFLDQPFGGLTGGLITYRQDGCFSNCCEGA